MVGGGIALSASGTHGLGPKAFSRLSPRPARPARLRDVFERPGPLDRLGVRGPPPVKAAVRLVILRVPSWGRIDKKLFKTSVSASGFS